MSAGTEFETNYTSMFWFSILARSRALHGAIAREIRNENPAGVYPLIRAFTETVVMMIYVHDHPQYIERLAARERDRPQGSPRRKSIQALVNYASKQAPGVKHIYADLSEATHVGSVAMWVSHRIEEADAETVKTSWSSEPQWRDEEQALIACAHTLELADAMETLLHNFAGKHLLPLARKP
jgi:hypothetical protein